VGCTPRRSSHDGVTMPMYDRTGPRGQGPRTGWGRGYCPPLSFGQETKTPIKPVIQVERPPTSAELSLWEKAEKLKRRAVLKAFAMRLQYANVVTAAKIAAKHKLALNEPELADLEVRMQAAITEIEALRQDHCDVNGMKLGVSPSAGKDLDIVQPPSMTFGAIWIPIAIGAVVVAGIIARWAYLETEVQTISDKFNGVLRRADEALCADPSSPMCQDWEATKSGGGYVQNETLIDSVKKAVKTVGGFAGKGIGIGLAVAIPLLMMIYLPRPKRNGKG
jgi:hypothetical protein